MTEKSPFESMTPESIKSEMLGRVINAGVDVDAREGSYANILLSEAAYVMWKYGQTLNGFIDILFPGAQSGRYLDLHAAQIGMTRQPGAKAKVTVTFSGVNGTKIPAGTVVCTPSALRFLTTEEVTIADGLASVLCVAEDIGADYNVPEAKKPFRSARRPFKSVPSSLYNWLSASAMAPARALMLCFFRLFKMACPPPAFNRGP